MASNGFRDYYKILQVHYDASPEVIRGAYKNLSKSYHPDSGRADSDHMALLNEAYTTLSNAASRKEYHKKYLQVPGSTTACDNIINAILGTK